LLDRESEEKQHLQSLNMKAWTAPACICFLLFMAQPAIQAQASEPDLMEKAVAFYAKNKEQMQDQHFTAVLTVMMEMERLNTEKERLHTDKERRAEEKERLNMDKERRAEEKERRAEEKESRAEEKERLNMDNERRTVEKERRAEEKERRAEEKERQASLVDLAFVQLDSNSLATTLLFPVICSFGVVASIFGCCKSDKEARRAEKLRIVAVSVFFVFMCLVLGCLGFRSLQATLAFGASSVVGGALLWCLFGMHFENLEAGQGNRHLT